MAEMPQRLQDMRRQVALGVDSDSIAGIEDLWYWQAEQMAPAMAEAESEFIKGLHA